MAHTATATEYRPQSFSTLVGQDFVSTAIKNSLNSQKIANAFLLSGPRGVGKTTTARLIAKGLNCIHGPTGEPCNECIQCTSIKEGNNSDVIEIDGASNTSINNIKTIQEEIQYLPAAAKYKIYIIDEVHMLSKSAFNALLKTIEEPPEHVVFIFATTELNEVPATIKSRCQQFNLRLIPSSIIEKNIEKILTDKNISFDANGIKWIAKEGKGSLRDAYTLLDQIISFCGDEVTLEKIQSKLGLAGKEQIAQIISFILNEQLMDIHTKLNELLSSGCRIEQILADIISFFRDILLLKSQSSSDDIKNNSGYYSPEILEKLSIYDIENILDLAFDFYEKLKYSINQEMELEFFLIKLTKYKDFIRPGTLLKQIKALQTAFLEKKKLNELEITKTQYNSSENIVKKEAVSIENNVNQPKITESQTTNIEALDLNKKNGSEKEKINIQKTISIEQQSNISQKIETTKKSENIAVQTFEIKNNIDEKEANIQKIIHNDNNVESISKTEKIEENKSQSFSLSSLLPNNINTNETSYYEINKKNLKEIFSCTEYR